MPPPPPPTDARPSVLRPTPGARGREPLCSQKREGPLAGAPDVERAYKRDPVIRRSGVATIPLGSPLPATSCSLPGSIERALAPCLALLRAGLAEPQQSPAVLVSSYLTVSPLPVSRRFIFCCA